MSEEIKIGEKGPFSELHHLTVVVQDVEKSVKYYSSLGIGPFIDPIGHMPVSKTPPGQPANAVKLLIREAKLDSIVLQLVQYISGECPYKDFVETKGEGVQSLGFTVADLDKEEARLVERGINVTLKRRRDGGGGFSYFDTEAPAGVVLEIRNMPDD